MIPFPMRNRQMRPAPTQENKSTKIWRFASVPRTAHDLALRPPAPSLK